MPIRKPANLPYPRLPAPTGPNFKGLSPLFLQYENGSNLVYKQLNAITIDTERPQIFHFKVIGLIGMYLYLMSHHFHHHHQQQQYYYLHPHLHWL